MTILLLLLPGVLDAQQPSRADALAAMKKAATFYAKQVSTHGGYHYSYADDLSYGRSEHSETPHHVEVQREGTPRVGMAFLEAYAATGDRLYLEAAQAASHALVKGQLCSGGWDYSIEFRPSERKKISYRIDDNCSSNASRAVTTLDDNVTQACVRLLMRTDKALGFSDKAIHETALYALDHLLQAQYPNGAWAQRFSAPPDPAKFPVKRASYPNDWPRKWPNTDYRSFYTFNDNTISDCIDMMLEAARIYKDPRYLASAEKGGGFMLLAQMPDPQPAWAQQYNTDMHPAWARQFEPPSVTGGESHGIMQTLLLLYSETGNRKYIEPIPRALDYLKRSVLPPAERDVEARRRMPKGTPVLARFYELKTNRPLYITKGMMLRVPGVPAPGRPDGYELSYTDESVITHYGVLVSGAWLAPLEAEYKRVAAADPKTLRRPDILHGLSPWSESQQRPRRASGVADIIRSLDDRGAWTQEGVIGKADKVVSVFVAKDMVLTINNKPVQLHENDVVELFRGEKPPRTRIINSETFARNLEALASYVKTN
ncbi:MAG: hypothetical protein HY820_01585 [Acidobacteria bacterium]|nr:hypothetical protein [Acidobacteriota bacterium]